MQRIARRILITGAAALAASPLLGEPISAEAFFDLRGGGSFTSDGDVDLKALGFSVGGTAEFEDSGTVGGRGGYWFESVPWVGLALDVSYFAPDIENGGPELDVIPVSPLLMLRAPIASDAEFPHGRFQPFLGIGPGIFITVLEDDSGYEDTPADVGLDLQAGLRFLATRNISLFLQYRFTSYQAQASDDIAGISVDTDIDLDTHHVAGGIGFSF